MLDGISWNTFILLRTSGHALVHRISVAARTDLPRNFTLSSFTEPPPAPQPRPSTTYEGQECVILAQDMLTIDGACSSLLLLEGAREKEGRKS
jgi:hypothetical protein